MKDKKRRLETYTFYDHTGLEKHLAEMASQGWLVEKIGPFLWTYRKIEPMTLSFSVCYFAEASQFDPEPSEEQQTFYDFCQHTGWTLAAASAQLQVFYNERENPVPIETDPVTEVESIHRAAKRSFLYPQFLTLAGAVVLTGMVMWQLIENTFNTLCSAASLFLCLLWPLMLLIAGTELGSYYAWRRKALKAAAQGEFLEASGRPVFQKVLLAAVPALSTLYILYMFTSSSRMLILATIVGLAYVAVVLLILSGIKELLKRKKVSADTNRMVTHGIRIFVSTLTIALIPALIFAADQNDVAGNGLIRDELPLHLSDLVEVPSGREIRQYSVLTQSPLVGYLDTHEYLASAGSAPGLDYDVVEVKLSVLYDLCKNEMLYRYDTRNNDRIPEGMKSWYEPADVAPWGAEEAYQRFSQDGGLHEKYLLCYPNRIVEIDFGLDWDVTPEQAAVVAEKLRGGEN